MSSFGTLRRVALVRTDVSEELSASFIRVTGISELGTPLAVTSNRRTLLIKMTITLPAPLTFAFPGRTVPVVLFDSWRNMQSDVILKTNF
jgi:hypothetical protein